MTWMYVAGFFDGEGHIGFIQAGERGRQVLQEIQAFLAALGITARIYTRAPRTQARVQSRLVGHALYVSSRQGVVAVCRQLLPYLRVKRVEVADILRFCTLFPPMTAGTKEFSLLNAEGCQTKRRRRGYRDPAATAA